MAKTFLELQNLVYNNLRIDEVTDFNQEEYELYIRGIINLAKETVEDAWQWHAFRKQIDWTSVASQHEYDLTATTSGSGDADVGSNLWLAGRSYPYQDRHGRLLAFDTTSNAFRLHKVPYWWGIQQKFLDTSDSAKPHHIYFTSTGVGFAYAPSSSSRTYSMIAIIPQDELSDTDDELTLPYWRPIVSLATAWAVNERGEELGNRPQLPNAVLMTDWESQSEQDLGRAISRDSTLDESELMMDAGQIPWDGNGTRWGIW